MPRTALVTGANRGIGAQVAEDLAAAGLRVLVGSRDPEAAGSLIGRIVGAGGVARAVQLDVTSDEQIQRLAARTGEVHVLVNNAGVALDGFDAEVVRRTRSVNVEGARALTRALWSRLAPDARIVNVSSGLADEAGLPDDLRARFESVRSESELGALLDDFERLVVAGDHESAGWPSSAYRVSKLGLNAMTRLWHAELEAAGRSVAVNSACPGWVRTEMGGAGAPRSVREGADTVVWLALSPPVSGGYFRDRAPAAW